MDAVICSDDKMLQVSDLLIAHRGRSDWNDINDNWGIENYEGRDLPKDIANLFLLRCLIDYQCISVDAWKRGGDYFNTLSEEHKHDLWQMIADKPLKDWTSEESFKKCNLHRWRRAHNRLWPIAKCICMFFDGDARNIWKSSTPFDVLCRLYYIGAGEQLSRMIVGALKDCGQITGRGDVKADVHVCRVLGRVFEGKEATPVFALKMARELKPDDPWQLDRSLWNLGQTNCDSINPRCSDCYLTQYCNYAQEHSLRG
jgi:hypothetical protein